MMSFLRIKWPVYGLMIGLLISAICVSCGRKTPNYYRLTTLQPNTAITLWNPADYDFETGNTFCLTHVHELEQQIHAAGACTSWRNGRYHGRNLDWYQGDYGCLVIQMPRAEHVPHASVAVLNASSSVTQQFLRNGVISDQERALLPCMVVDGINDAGVVVNINIVPHDPMTDYRREGDLCCMCVVRYLLDHAGSVAEAVELLRARTVAQSIVSLAGDETHYMISDADTTVVVEWEGDEMIVTGPIEGRSIMTNLYDYAVARYGLATDSFYDNHPYAMGVERWNTVCQQYDAASRSVESNLAIAQSVWYFRHLMTERDLWYSENALPSGYGRDEQGWYYMVHGTRHACADVHAAQLGYWQNNMESYWARYDSIYGAQSGEVSDPHVSSNHYWETSHTVIYDLEDKRGYLYPFENRYSSDNSPLVITLPR